MDKWTRGPKPSGRAGEMAQLAKCLQELSVGPKGEKNKLDMVIYACNLKLGRQRQEDP